MAIDARRKTNGRYRDAMAQLALLRLGYGRYRTMAQVAVDMNVNEGTVRDWLRWWRQAFGVRIARNSSAELVVETWGAIEPGRLLEWMESGQAFDAAEFDGQRYKPGYVPWVRRDWPETANPFMAVRPAFVPSGEPAPLTPDELPL